ncbi:MAG: hypothetical protein NZ585_12765 [Chloracidobacterium sp.]|nr:hypothetical protein [Chloracidobacterium sp.]MDW8217841.1 hypothetical protein [Acidobacteriota bacterium]
MKFKTFLALVIAGGVVASALVVGSCVWLLSTARSRRPAASQPSLPSSPQASPIPADENVLRPVDRDLLEALRRPATTDRIKDAFPNRPYKISLYCDTPGQGWNRAKIDLNRNSKWDEKITIINGEPVKRLVASRDDENYDVEYRWRGGRWVSK